MTLRSTHNHRIRMRSNFGGGLAAACLAAIASTGCGRAEADAPSSHATQYIVGVDISASRTPTQLEEARRLLRGIVGRMKNGDRIVLIETYRSGTDAARQYSDSIAAARKPERPSASDRKKMQRFQASTSMIAERFVDAERSKTIQSTNLLMTLQRAADYAKAANGRQTTVLLLSDMLNSTPELNMERPAGIPDARWVAERKTQGQLPDLRGICVFAVGGEVGTRRTTALRRFWREYFAAAGATYSDERNYRNMVADPREVGCS
jgi:hypothetical protein